MICTHCSKRKRGEPVVCTCTLPAHLVCQACARPPAIDIAALNAAWVAPLSRDRIERTRHVFADLAFMCEPQGNA